MLLISLSTACNRATPTYSAAQLLDLGEKYLLELDYEQAAIYFEMLLDIEPRNPRGYTGLAEAYVGLGQPDRAQRVLQLGLRTIDNDDANAELSDALSKLPVPTANANTQTSQPEPSRTANPTPEKTPEPTTEPTTEPTAVPTAQQPADSGYILPQSSERLLTVDDLRGLTAGELSFARNEIYARHGRKFANAKIAAHFNAQHWYVELPTHYEPDEFDRMTGVLSSVETANVEFIRSYENGAVADNSPANTSANSEVAAAYIKVLQDEGKPDISSYGQIESGVVCASVVDLNNDGIPELVYFRKRGDYGIYCDLLVYSFRSSECVRAIYIESLFLEVCSGSASIYSYSNGGLLAIGEQGGEVPYVGYYTYYVYNDIFASPKITTTTFYEYDHNEDIPEHYSVNDNAATKNEFDAVEKKMLSGAKYYLGGNWSNALSGAKDVSMSYDAALKYLNSLKGN